MRDVLLIVALCAAAPVGAQSDHRTVDAGMHRSEVVERFGLPAAEHVAGSLSFLFYEADCQRPCDAEDVVVLEDDAVVDALLLPPYRVYSGGPAPAADTLEMRPPEAVPPDSSADPDDAEGAEEREDTPSSTFSARPLLPTGQPGIPHGHAEAVNTPPGVPAGTTTVAGFSVPAPGAPTPEGWWVAPFVGARPAPEDAARSEWLRRHAVVRQFLSPLSPDSVNTPSDSLSTP